MKFSLNINQTHSLVLSPQLQQSLALLQAPLCDLRALMTTFINDNPCVDILDKDMSEEEILFRNDKAELPEDMQWTSLALNQYSISSPATRSSLSKNSSSVSARPGLFSNGNMSSSGLEMLY